MPGAISAFDKGISNFLCAKNEELAYFLKNSAIEFEKLDKSRTYLLVDEEDEQDIPVLGYFSIAVHSIEIPETMESKKIRLLDGYSAKNHNKTVASVPAYLIGQLAKNDLYAEDVDGDELLNAAINIVEKARLIAGGRLIVIDCKPIQKLHDFYERNGFMMIGHNKESELDQFVYFMSTQWMQGGKVVDMTKATNKAFKQAADTN